MLLRPGWSLGTLLDGSVASRGAVGSTETKFEFVLVTILSMTETVTGFPIRSVVNTFVRDIFWQGGGAGGGREGGGAEGSRSSFTIGSGRGTLFCLCWGGREG